MRIKNIQLLISIFLTATVLGCSGGAYRIRSSPTDADVYLISNAGAKKNLGKTPLAASAAEVNPQRESFLLEIHKDGFLDQLILVSDSTFAKNIEAQIELKPSLVSADAHKEEISLNEISSGVAEVQKNIQTKNYDSALESLTRLIEGYPSVAALYSLSGNIYYLQRRNPQALSAYRRAAALNGTSPDVFKMIKKIEEINGDSK